MKTYEQALDDIYQYATHSERNSRAVYLFQTNAISWGVFCRVWKNIGEQPPKNRGRCPGCGQPSAGNVLCEGCHAYDEHTSVY